MATERRILQLRLVRVFTAIFTANILTWLPALVAALAGAILSTQHTPTPLNTVAYLALQSEIVIHPILQACFIKEVRVTMSGYLGLCWKKIKCCIAASTTEAIPTTQKATATETTTATEAIAAETTTQKATAAIRTLTHYFSTLTSASKA